MKHLGIFLLTLPAMAHHGQDFLVTLDTGTVDPWKFRTTFGGEYSEYAETHEASLTQSIILGLPNRFSLSSVLRFADEGSGRWESLSVTPTLQWTTPDLLLGGSFSSLKIGFAAGWEIPIESGHDHSSDHNGAPMMDCSGLVGIPPLFQACQQANQNAANHTHGGGGHGHTGIHRHGERHGFARFIAELNPTPKDRIVFNTIAVFPDDESEQWGYAVAYRHRFSDGFAFGVEATGDFDTKGEHLVYLTGTSYLNHQLSFTLGAATGLNDRSPDFSIQTLVSWRF